MCMEQEELKKLIGKSLKAKSDIDELEIDGEVFQSEIKKGTILDITNCDDDCLECIDDNKKWYYIWKENLELFEEVNVKEVDNFNSKVESKMNKENNTIITKLMGEMGVCEDARMTMDGKVAIKRKNGDFVRYDEDKKAITNYMDFIIEGTESMCMITPVQEIQTGDVIKNGDSYIQVTYIDKKNGDVKGKNLTTGRNTSIVKENNITGVNFYNKLVSLMEGFKNDNNSINPMMLMLMDDEKGDSSDIMKMMLMSQMTNDSETNENECAAKPIDPTMLMMLMMKDKGEVKDNMAGMLIMSQMMKGNKNTMKGVNPMMLMMMGDKSGKCDMFKFMLMNQMLQQNK